ncbi:MAG: alpha/beta hydrolase, partial [Paracoccaceae bacterium]|nr:alpha/beta hydrolase [Paracoccaceae bacterium]
MDMDKAYANGAFIAGADAYSPRWQARAAAFRAALGPRARLNIPYGPAPRQQFDLFMPGTVATGCLVFVHGGYWLGSGRQDWSHLAAGAVARGWACAMPSYTLAPQARIAAMTVEIAAAVGAVAQSVTGPLIITGHSAGGHLAARMGCADQTFAAAHRIARVVP